MKECYNLAAAHSRGHSIRHSSPLLNLHDSDAKCSIKLVNATCRIPQGELMVPLEIPHSVSAFKLGLLNPR